MRQFPQGLCFLSCPGVSAGHMSKVVVGNNRQQYFLVIGRAVDEVRLAQNLAKAGEIILSPNGWELCQRKLIEVQKIPNERAVKVSTWYCGLLWEALPAGMVVSLLDQMFKRV